MFIKRKVVDTLKKYELHLKSLSPLIMHSDKGCNPLNPITKKIKEISSIRGKKDEHYLAMARLEFEIGLYYHEEVGIYIPSKCLAACFKTAAKKFKLGKASKAIYVDAPLGAELSGYEKETPQTLWDKKDKKDNQVHTFVESVVVNRARIMRTRPIFHTWEVKFSLYLNTEILSFDQLKKIIETAGLEFGLCELRPGLATGSYGRFVLEKIKEVK